MAYDSIVTVVEPEMSIFDFKMCVYVSLLDAGPNLYLFRRITTYLALLSLFGGAGYLAYKTLVPQPKKIKAKQVSAPVGTVTATGAGGYQEEWIPEHHIRKGKKSASGVATSGDELSGGETSGAETKSLKGRKGRK